MLVERFRRILSAKNPLVGTHARGKMHDLRKSEKDSTLEHSLFAAFNTE